MTLPPLPELKPCPFCEGEKHFKSSNGVESNYVVCAGCGAEGPAAETTAAAHAAWNRRAAIAAHVPAVLAAVPAQPGIRTLSSEQIERHTLTASECPPDSAVMLVSSINRLLGKSRGEGIRLSQPVAFRVRLDGMWFHGASREGLIAAIGVKLGRSIAEQEVEPLYAAPQAVPVPAVTITDDPWRKLYRRAINEANGLTNYVEDRPELRGAERRLAAIEAEARTLAQNGEKL